MVEKYSLSSKTHHTSKVTICFLRTVCRIAKCYDFDWISGELEDLHSDKLQKKTSANVLPYVGVACLGAILFGYHLAYVTDCY